MDENRKCFTIIWKIKNFSLSFNRLHIISPYFFSHSLSNSFWWLMLLQGTNGDQVICYMMRANDDSSPDVPFEIDFELSFLSADGSVIQSAKYLKKIFIKTGDVDKSSILFAKRDEVYLLKKNQFIPNDTLTIRCKIWNSQETISKSIRCLSECEIEPDCKYLQGTVENFSRMEPKKKYKLNINFSRISINFSMETIYINTDDVLNIEVESIGSSISYFKCKIFIIDKFEFKVKAGQDEIYNKKRCIPLAVTKDYLVKNNECFLPNDTLTIRCEFYSFGNKKTNEVQFEFDYEDTQGSLNNAENINALSENIASQIISS